MPKDMPKTQLNLLKILIQIFNIIIQGLAEFRIHIHDNDDFDFALDYIHYSTAQDKVICRHKRVENEDGIEESGGGL